MFSRRNTICITVTLLLTEDLSIAVFYELLQEHYISHLILYHWSSAGRSFVMRSLNPCPENFDQNYQLEMFDSEGGGGIKLPNINCDQTTKWKITKHTNHK